MSDVSNNDAGPRRRCTVIAGVSGGIGQAVLHRFREDRIVAVDRSEEVARDSLLAAGLRADGIAATAIGADFSNPGSVTQAAHHVRQFSKEIDSLVNCIGVAEDAAFQMMSVESLNRQMQINFVAAMQLCQFASRLMARNGGGTIVNVASVTAMDGNIGQVAYGASKAALVNATTTMSMELGPMGIRVNAVAPGVIDTPMTQMLPAEKLTSLKLRIGMGRLGRPDEIADVIYWLSSDEASYVAGQTVRVDGCM